MRYLILVLALLFVSVGAFADTETEETKLGLCEYEGSDPWGDLKKDHCLYLVELGYNDHSAEISKNVDKGIAPFSDAVHLMNSERYGLFNEARELAVHLFAEHYAWLEAEDAETRDASRRNISNLTARMLTLQPMNPPLEYPPKVNHMPEETDEDIEAKEAAAIEYVKEEVTKTLESHIKMIVSDLAETTWGRGELEYYYEIETKGKKIDKEKAEADRKVAELDKLEEPLKAVGNVFELLVAERNLSKEENQLKTKYEKELKELGEQQKATRKTRTQNEDRLKEIAEDRAALAQIMKRLNSYRDNVVEMMHHLYTEHEMSQTRYLGRALLACLMKYIIENNDQELLAVLEEQINAQGIMLENFFGDTLHLENEKGEIQVDTVENGAIVIGRSLSILSAEIGFAAVPSWKGWEKIVDHGLVLGSIAGFAVSVLEMKSPHATSNPGDRIRHKYKHSAWLLPGYTHAGIFWVPETELTKPNGEKETVRMLWILDNYPSTDYYTDEGEAVSTGGIRIGGFEQFALNGPYMRVGIVHYDPELFFDHGMEWVKEHGYKKDAWPAFKELRDGTPTQEVDNWPTEISEADFWTLHDPTVVDGETKLERAQRWKKDVFKLTTDLIVDKFLYQYGVGFAYGFSNTLGRTYCTQTPELAAMQAAGVSLEKWPDHFNLGLRIMKWIGLPEAQDMDFDSRIVSPNGFIVQPFSETVRVDYPDLNPLERVRAAYMHKYIEMDVETTKLLAEMDPTLLKDLIYDGYIENWAGILSGEVDANITGLDDLEKLTYSSDPTTQAAAILGRLGELFGIVGDQAVNRIKAE